MAHDKILLVTGGSRGGQPAEVAATIAWRLSEAASYVCGTHVDMADGL
ncbi:MAG: hypothetical protein R3E34_11065 [Rhodocyclaceae bacterium]